MPVIKVWCLPDMEEDELNRLHKGIVGSVCAVKELGLKDENDMTTLFPADKMKYGLGTDIIVEVTGLDDKPERTKAVRQLLARNVGLIVSEFFPDAKVEAFVRPEDRERDTFWCSDMLTVASFQNPTGNWEYDGPFQAHLTDDASFDKVAHYQGIEIDGTIITVGKDESFPGRIAQSMGGIQMYAGIDQPLYWGYKYLIRLTKLDGELIWENKQL